MVSQSTVANKLEFQTYTPELVPAVKAFNLRLLQRSFCDTLFPETHVPSYPKRPDTDIYQERFLLLHDAQVRGGYVLTHQSFVINGEQVRIACGPQLALSEGIVDPRYGTFGVLIVEDALDRQRLMYGLGMSGMQGPLTRLMGAMGWKLHSIPFYFKVVKPSRFLANINYVRTSAMRRLALDLLRYTGMGQLAIRAAQLRTSMQNSSIQAETFDEFGSWADELWDQARNEYSFISLRDRRTLNIIYPTSEQRFLRLKVSLGPTPLGWAVMREDYASGDSRFGDMRVGVIMDCLARREHASYVIHTATKYLKHRGVDLIWSNQANDEWCKALSATGFLRGPSTFVLGLSPDLYEMLQPFEAIETNMHINRGNGHGPILEW
jgi:hypothetical protein